MDIKEIVNKYQRSKTTYENCRFWLIDALKRNPELRDCEKYLDKLEFGATGISYRGRRFIAQDELEDYELFFRYEDFGLFEDIY